MNRDFRKFCHFRILRWGLITVLGLGVCNAQNIDPLPLPSRQVLGIELGRELDLKGVSVPLGRPNDGLRIRCDRIRVVSKQVGGMRIGLIPELEVTGMNLEVRGRVPASAWCGLVQSFFQSEPLLSQSCFQNFSLVFDSTKKFRLEAKAACFKEAQGVLLLEKPALKIGGDRFPFHRADLILEGEQAGKLVIADDKGRRLGLHIPVENLPSEFNHRQKHDKKEK
jgi:hypothetical protein